MITSTLNTSPPMTAPIPMSDSWKMPIRLSDNSGPLQPNAMSVAPATSSGISNRSLITSMVRTKYSSQVKAIPQKRYKISGHHSQRFQSLTSVSVSASASASASASLTSASARPRTALGSADKDSEAVATSVVSGTEAARLTSSANKGNVASFATTKAHLGQLLRDRW